MNEEEENCSICLNKFGEEECHNLDECNHKFHTKCIVSWFRKASTCPNCRDNTIDEIKNIPAYILSDRSKELRKISHRNNAPKELKNKVKKLKNIETKIKQTSKNLIEFRKENKEILNTFNKLRRQRWDFRAKKIKMERQIGLFQSPKYQLPALIIHQCPYNY